MWLGKPELPRETLDRWGVYSENLESRLRTAMPTPAPWEYFGGRPDGGLIATQAPDLVLRLAEETARLKLPAQLVPGLLMYAVQDYWHDVDSRFPDDWPAMARQALALSPSRVEDYVAALAGGGPVTPAVKRNLLHFYDWRKFARGLTLIVHFMRTIGVLLVLSAALVAQEPQPRG